MSSTNDNHPTRLITGLNAVVLIADDFVGQVAFYRDMMGFKVICSYTDAVFFEVGSQKLAVFARGHHPEGDHALRGASHGLSHLEFNIPASALAEMESRLRKAGAHAYRDNYQDADGNIFHFVS